MSTLCPAELLLLARGEQLLTNAWLANVVHIEVSSCHLDRTGDKVLHQQCCYEAIVMEQIGFDISGHLI